MDAPLRDRVIVVIGGTTGLGLAGTLACRRAGARVLAVGLDAVSVEAVEAQGDESLAGITGDARDPSVAATAIAAAQSRWTRLDGLYHVAGGSGRRHGDGPLHEMPDTGWSMTLDLNLSSAAWSKRAAVKAFRDAGRAARLSR